VKVIEIPIEVRYAETDQMGVVYHANYLIWFEVGRTALLDSIGLDYFRLEEEGFVSPVLKVAASFHRPARYGKEALVRTWVEAYDGLRITYGYEILSGGQLCVTGTTVHVLVRREDFRPVSLRRHFPKWDAVYNKLKHN